MGMMNRKELEKLKPGQRVKPRTVTGRGRTKQEFREDSDINCIVQRYKKSGVLPAGRRPELLQFADVSEVRSFSEMYERVEAGKAAFNSLAPEIRARFKNSPADLLDFLGNPENRGEAVKLGLVNPVKAPSAPSEPPLAAPVVPPAPVNP